MFVSWILLWISVGILGVWIVVLTDQFRIRCKEWDDRIALAIAAKGDADRLESLQGMIMEVRELRSELYDALRRPRGDDDDDSYATLGRVRKMSIESGGRIWDEIRRVHDKLRGLEGSVAALDTATGTLLRQVQENNGKIEAMQLVIEGDGGIRTCVDATKRAMLLCDADRKAMAEQLASACKNLDALCDRVAALEGIASVPVPEYDPELHAFSQPIKVRTDTGKIVYVPGPEKPGEKIIVETTPSVPEQQARGFTYCTNPATPCKPNPRPFLSFGDGVQWRVGDSLHTGKPVLLDNGGYVLDGDDVMVKHDYGCGISFVPQLHLSPYPNEPIPEPQGGVHVSQQ